MGVGDQGVCERRIEVFVKIQKNQGGRGDRVGVGVSGRGRVWEIRLDVKEGLKFL